MSHEKIQANLEHNKRHLMRWFDEVWNQERTETIHEMYGENCVLHDAANPARNRAEFLKLHEDLRAQYADIKIVPIHVIAEGDLVAMHWSLKMRHRASNRPVNVTGTSIVRVAKGQFVEAWENWDTAQAAQQIATE